MDSWEPRYKFQTAVFEKGRRQKGLKRLKRLKRLKSIEHSAEGIGTVWREMIIDKIGKGQGGNKLRLCVSHRICKIIWRDLRIRAKRFLKDTQLDIEGLKSKLLSSHSLTLSLLSRLSQKKGGTELALGTPKTPKNQLKTISYSVCKTDMFLVK